MNAQLIWTKHCTSVLHSFFYLTFTTISWDRNFHCFTDQNAFTELESCSLNSNPNQVSPEPMLHPLQYRILKQLYIKNPFSQFSLISETLALFFLISFQLMINRWNLGTSKSTLSSPFYIHQIIYNIFDIDQVIITYYILYIMYLIYLVGEGEIALSTLL